MGAPAGWTANAKLGNPSTAQQRRWSAPGTASGNELGGVVEAQVPAAPRTTCVPKAPSRGRTPPIGTAPPRRERRWLKRPLASVRVTRRSSFSSAIASTRAPGLGSPFTRYLAYR
jgi:hypothetical protein